VKIMTKGSPGWTYSVVTLFSAGVEPSPLLLRPLLAYCTSPRMMMDNDECGATGGMFGRGNRSTLRKPGPVPLCPS
jgi:hypothetical protein